MFAQVIANAVLAAAGYCLMAVGFSLLYKSTRFFDFSFGAVYALSAYSVLSLQQSAGIPLVLACLGGVVVGALTSLLLELAVFRGLRRRGAGPLTLLVGSIGIYIFVQHAIAAIWGERRRRIVDEDLGDSIFNIAGATFTYTQLGILAVSALLLGVFWLLLGHTRLGIALRALGENPTLTSLSGVPTERYKLYAHAIAGAFSGAAAIALSFDTFMAPAMGFDALLIAIVALIVGGTRSVEGAALGAILLALSENLAVMLIPSSWKSTIAYVILLLFLLLRPQGILGSQPT